MPSLMRLADRAALPANWHEATDDSGRQYYYNSLTQQSSWTRPPPSASTLRGG